MRIERGHARPGQIYSISKLKFWILDLSKTRTKVGFGQPMDIVGLPVSKAKQNIFEKIYLSTPLHWLAVTYENYHTRITTFFIFKHSPVTYENC